MFCLMFKNLLSWIESVSIQSSLACLWPSDCSLANKNKAHGFPRSHWHTKERMELFTVNQPFKTPCHKQSLTFAPLVFGWVSVFTSGVILSGFQVPVNESTIGDGLCAAAVYLLSGWQMISIRCSSRQECSQVSAKTPPRLFSAILCSSNRNTCMSSVWNLANFQLWVALMLKLKVQYYESHFFRNVSLAFSQ